MMRGKIHSLHGGRKAYLNFELKDHGPPEAARQSKSDRSDFDIINADLGNSRDRCASLTSTFRDARIQPCNEWKAMAGAAVTSVIVIKRSVQLDFCIGASHCGIMTALLFDTLRLSHTLLRTGRGPGRAVGEATQGDLATKGDLASVGNEIAKLRSELKTGFAQLRSELRTEIAAVRAEMAGFSAELRTEIADLRTELIWTG